MPKYLVELRRKRVIEETARLFVHATHRHEVAQETWLLGEHPWVKVHEVTTPSFEACIEVPTE